MAFVPITDRAAGYALAEADWDAIKDNMNGATWVQLADTTLTGTAAEIAFATIDQTFSHLLVHAYLASTTGSGAQTRVRFNSDTGSNYDYQELYGTGASAVSGEQFGQTSILAGYMAGSSHTNQFSSHVFQIPAYSQATGHKVLLSRWSLKTGTATGEIRTGGQSGFWRATTAVSNVKLIPSTGSLAIGSRATLYALA